MKNSVLVTGGCGFVGSNLVKKLVAQGYQVRVLDNLFSGKRDYLNDIEYEFIEGDITKPETLENAFSDVSEVVHLAAYGSVVESVDDPLANFQTNVAGTLNVLNMCVKHGVKKMVFASTGGALIGNAELPVDEKSLPKPISPYGASKLCCEAYCYAYSQSYDLKTVCLRFANVYGPNSNHKKGVINKFFANLENDLPLVVYGDGSSTRDYIHVFDLTDGISMALSSSSAENKVIHLANGREVSLNELADTVVNAAGKKHYPIDYKESRKGEVERNFASYDYANELLGFKPKVSLEDGLTELWSEGLGPY